MRFLLLMFLSAVVVADTICWDPVTTSKDGRALNAAVTYQVYENGKPYGQPVTTAATCDKPYSVPSCSKNYYWVTAQVSGAESDPSNTVTMLPCIPSAPKLEQVIPAQVLACKAEGLKTWAANAACQRELLQLKARR
jgi:hypothetical protein